ncbi:monofunctional biosynthetic peptidoglycan transglycosylase [Kaistia sp. 32K]|uniref:monofunctional biosynthetic peptidoglycan transglycosylase n=1 Tax=Kaistia sp. 32K TaxID=2795690 RepID=UPI001915B972|nr:monofunctional biosynthetic peptidoglycan transglycosylase [Kaistia sp. 32K]BCP55398.1 monofunctional biosynthetic peptidoglycan transglycosylase [Kaistia sp. 32K]
MTLRLPAALSRPFAARRGLITGIAKVFAIIVALPLVLTPIYAFVPPVSTLMLWSGATGQGMKRDWTPLENIAPALVNSVVMSEDGQYCSHSGVDWGELSAALDRQGGPSRGASTITMQTVKNLFLWPSRSYLRKALEIPLAYYADFMLSKRRVMEIYLNIAEWGPGLFGAEAAAQHYFNKPASKLTAREAALLTAALPNPITRNPAKPTRYLQNRARNIQARARAARDYVGCI